MPGRCSKTWRLAGAVTLVAGGLLVGCSGSVELSADERNRALELVGERSMDASIELSDEDLSCVVDQMGPEDLERLVDRRVDDTADLVVSCVGEELIGRSVLRSLTGELSESSLECAVDELERRFVVDLVARAMVGELPRARVEIEVARVLSSCLELDELI